MQSELDKTVGTAVFKRYAGTGLAVDIEHFQQLYIDRWRRCFAGPFPLKSVSDAEKLKREARLEQLVQRLAGVVKYPFKTVKDRQAVRKNIRQAFARYFHHGLEFTAKQIDYLFQCGMIENAARFALAAADFDPGLEKKHIYQASRNAWVMFGLQNLMGKPVYLTPSILAYSLLYPYTDNYLDHPGIGEAEKSRFNSDFAARLAGENVTAKNSYEQTIYKLVSMIESEWDRQAYPRIYQSLLAINWAQHKSLELLGRPSSARVRDISFLKGGTSVLADGFLVAGDLAPEQMLFLYGYGIVLQLIDDVQDIGQDRASGLKTLFSANGDLESNVNKSLHLTPHVMSQLEHFSAAPPPLAELVQNSACYLFVDAVGRSRQYVDRKFSDRMQNFSPVRFGALDSIRKRSGNTQIPFFDILKIFAFPGGTDSPDLFEKQPDRDEKFRTA